MASLGSVAVSIGMQLAIPRVLLSRWGDGGYSVYVTVTGIAAYVSLADAGVQMFLTQRLTALRGAGKDEEAAKLARGALKALSLLAIAGLGVLGVALCAFGLTALQRVIASSSLSRVAFFWAIAVQLTSAAFALATGGWSSAVEQSNEKYSRTPIAFLCRSLASSAVLLGCARGGVLPSTALIASACASLPIDIGRFLWSRTLVPRGHEAARVADVLREAKGSLFMMIAGATQAGLWPAVAAAVAPLTVGVAIPARTVANGARLVSSVAQNVLWVPLARRFASISDPEEVYEFWARHSPILALVQMAGVVSLVVVAPAMVQAWLPKKAVEIDLLLPVFGVEQALLIAAVPSLVLLLAVGRFGRLGAVQLAQAIVGIAVTLILMPRLGALGFALASVVSTATCTVPTLLLAEYKHWSLIGQRPLVVLAPRVALAAAAVACAVVMSYSRTISAAVAFVILALGGAHALSSQRRARAVVLASPRGTSSKTSRRQFG